MYRGSTCGVTVFMRGNGESDPSSNPGWAMSK